MYKDGSASLFLRKNPTRYEILHESQHIEHLRQIGRQRYIELSRTAAGNQNGRTGIREQLSLITKLLKPQKFTMLEHDRGHSNRTDIGDRP